MTESANDSTGTNPKPRRRSTGSGKSKATSRTGTSRKKTGGTKTSRKSASEAAASSKPKATRAAAAGAPKKARATKSDAEKKSSAKKSPAKKSTAKRGTAKRSAAKKGTGRTDGESMRDALSHVAERPSRRRPRTTQASRSAAPPGNTPTMSSASTQSQTAPANDAVAVAASLIETNPIETSSIATGALETIDVEATATAVAEPPVDTASGTDEALEVTIEAVEPAPAAPSEVTSANEVEAIDKLATETQAIMERLLAAVDEQHGKAGSTNGESMVEAVADAASDFEVELIEDEAVTIAAVDVDSEPAATETTETTTPPPEAGDAIPAFESSETGSWLMDPEPTDQPTNSEATTTTVETPAADATVAVDYAEPTTESVETTTVTVQEPAGTLTVAAPVIATSAASPSPDDTLLFVKIVAPFLLGVGAGLLIGLLG
ncbi:MAG: hypothetical protein NXI31_24830 [bacterium]|nr:hypothetical protein [bacterium]